MLAFLRLIFLFSLFTLFSVMSFAQIDSETQNGRGRDEPLPQSIKETLAKRRVEEEKKEYDELLKKSENAMRLSKEIQDSFAKNKKLTSKDRAKLKDLEKLLKKVRKDLGGSGESEDEFDEAPKSTATALSALYDTTAQLFEEIKKTSRHAISAVAINSSNAILGLVRFLRLGN